MRRLAALFAVSALVSCLGMLVSASPASAGGPTTIVVSAVNLERATALVYSDPEFLDLTTLLGSGETGKQTEPPDLRAEYATVTWLMYDGEIGRVDRVHYAGADPWIWSQVRYSAERTARRGLWHRSGDGSALVAMLNRMVLAPVEADPDRAAQPQPGTDKGSGLTAAVVGRQLTPAMTTSAVVAAADLRGWPFAVLGVAGGAVLTLLAGLGLAALRRRSADDERDQRAPLPVLMLGDG